MIFNIVQNLSNDVENKIKEQQQRGFLICILGPGNGNKYYTVRCKIKDALTNNGFNTFFPEEVVGKTDQTGDTITEDYLLRVKADFIINIPISEGSQVEMGRYASDEETKNKFSVFIEEKYAQGILELWHTGVLPSYLIGMYIELRVRHIQTFDQDDLDKCNNCGESDIVKNAIRLSRSEALKRTIPSTL